MRYKISDTIHFLNIPASLQNAAVADRILLKDDLQDRQFFVNPTTRLFIEKFKSPKSFAEINKEISIETNTGEQELKKIITPFFRYIKNRKFIVHENCKPIKTKSAPLLQKDALLDEYKIESFLGDNDDVEIYKAIDLRNKKCRCN